MRRHVMLILFGACVAMVMAVSGGAVSSKPLRIKADLLLVNGRFNHNPPGVNLYGPVRVQLDAWDDNVGTETSCPREGGSLTVTYPDGTSGTSDNTTGCFSVSVSESVVTIGAPAGPGSRAYWQIFYSGDEVTSVVYGVFLANITYEVASAKLKIK